MLKPSRKTVAVAATLLTGASLTTMALVTASAASADAVTNAIGGGYAPYAQAAAAVKADGTVVRSKGVTAVTKISTGQYCIQLDPGIDATKTVPTATAEWSGSPWGASIYIRQDASVCGADTARNIFVGTGTASGAKDMGFDVVVP